MSKQILKYVVLSFAIVGLLTTIDTALSVYHDYGKTFVVAQTVDYTKGKSGIAQIGLYDNRSQVILMEERGFYAIRTLDMDRNNSFRPGDRVSFDLLGSPHRL